MAGGSRFDPHALDYITHCIRYLARNGSAVSVVDYKYTKSDRTIERTEGLTVYRLTVFGLDEGRLYKYLRVKPLFPGWIVERILWGFALAKYVLKYRREFDVFFCNYSFATLLLSIAFPNMRKKLIYYSMVLIEEGKHGFLNWYRIFFHSIIGHLAAVSITENAIAARCLVAAGLKSDKVISIEPGIDLSFWKPVSFEEITRDFSLENKTVILFQAKIVQRKGVEYLIKAADILVNKNGYRNLVFLIVGPAKGGVGIAPRNEELLYVENLQKLIKSLKLDQNVKLVIGWHRMEKLREFYSAADIYVLPTLRDLTPHSIKQAMVLGKPIVTTRVGWVPTMIADGVNGFIVEPKDEVGLADALKKLITNPELRRQMSFNNIDRVKRCWSIEEKAKIWEELFLNVYQSCKRAS